MFFDVFRLIAQWAIDVLTSSFDVLSSIPNVFCISICNSWIFLQGNQVIADAARHKFVGHFGYSNEELIALTFFDSRVSFDEKRVMLKNFKEKEGKTEPPKRLKLRIGDHEAIRTPSSFVTQFLF